MPQARTKEDDHMKVTVLYFGQLKEEAGTASESVEIDPSTVAKLYDQLKERHGLTMPFDNLRAARNENFCKATETVRPDDVIAFMPPMSGG